MDRMLALSIGVAIASGLTSFAFAFKIAYEFAYTKFYKGFEELEKENAELKEFYESVPVYLKE